MRARLAPAQATVRALGTDDGRGTVLSRGLDQPRRTRASARRNAARLPADRQLRDTRRQDGDGVLETTPTPLSLPGPGGADDAREVGEARLPGVGAPEA